jgi:hypothetical protein
VVSVVQLAVYEERRCARRVPINSPGATCALASRSINTAPNFLAASSALYWRFFELGS